MSTCDEDDGRLVVVTGGAGFIGSHLVEALLGRGYPVRVVDNLATGHRANLASVTDRFGWVEGDLADFDVAMQALDGAWAVLHEAAIPSVPRSFEEPLLSHASGPTATLHVLEAARRRGVARVVYAASSSAYGNAAALPKREDMPTQPLSPYAAGKLAGEAYVSVYAQSTPVDAVSLRYFNVYGPRQDPSSPYSGVISIFARAAIAGRVPTIYGDGQQTRDFTFVSDVVQANLLALEAPDRLGGQVVNVGSGRRTSLIELWDTLCRLTGHTIRPTFAPERVGDVRDSLACLKRAERVLGYRPSADLEQGLAETLTWARTAETR